MLLLLSWISLLLLSPFVASYSGSIASLSHRDFRDLLHGYGYEHVSNIFPHSDDYGIAIAKTWAKIIEEESNIHLSGTRREWPYLGCIEYRDFKESAENLQRMGIEHHVTFSSADKERVCVQAFMQYQQLLQIEMHRSMGGFQFLLPIPNRLKVDSSIVAATHWLFAGNNANNKSLLVDSIATNSRSGDGIEENHGISLAGSSRDRRSLSIATDADHTVCPLFSRVNTFTALRQSARVVDTQADTTESAKKIVYSTCHPITHAVAKMRDLELAVSIRRSMSVSEMKVEVAKWFAWLQIKGDGKSTSSLLSGIEIYPEAPDYSGLDIGISTWNEVNPVTNKLKSRKSRTKNYRRLRIAHGVANTRHAKLPHYRNFDVDFDNFKEHKISIDDTSMTDFSHLQETRRVEMRRMWRSINEVATKKVSDSEPSSIATECRWNLLKASDVIHFRKRSIHVRLHRDLLDESSASSASCLALLVSAIAESHEVIRLALSEPIHLANDYARATTQSGSFSGNLAVREPLSAISLDGTGEVVGISDSGLDEYSCFFYDSVNGILPRASRDEFTINPFFDLSRRKVVQYIAYTSSGSVGDWTSGHGSHTSGTIAGKCGNPSVDKSAYNGVASGAKLAMFDIGQKETGKLDVPWNLALIFESSYKATARIHSDSWGGGYWYDSYCQEVDEYVDLHDDFVLVFAAGNDGSVGYQSVMSPGLSKNAIAASSSKSHPVSGVISSFSSAGPAPDGRIKPDVVAPGDPIYSAQANVESSHSQSCSTTSKQGTSMATPVTAGNAALIRQYFRRPQFWANFCNKSYRLCQLGSFPPKGSLVKAILLHSGSTMNQYNGIYSNIGRKPLTTLPDSLQGYGKIKLTNVLQYTSNVTAPFQLFVDYFNVTDFTEVVYDVTVFSSVSPLKVTLCWYDPPNEVFAAKLLLNDVDLVMVDPDGSVYYGNLDQRDGIPHESPNRDDLNTNEQITIDRPKNGTWKLHVQAKQLAGREVQAVALVLTAHGVVSGDGLDHILHKYNPGVLNHCPASPGSIFPEQRVIISKWSLGSGYHEGSWTTGTIYKIIDEKNGIESTLAQGTNKLPFGNDYTCLAEGCYSLELDLVAAQNVECVQASITDCNIRVTAMVPSQGFCLVSPMGRNSSNVGFYPDTTCISSCEVNAHFVMRLELIEGGGVGWEGAYFSLHRLNVIKTGFETIANTAVGSGTLEWGFGEYQTTCIPAGSKCYLMTLSIPDSDEGLDPLLYFRDAKLFNSDGVTLSDIDCPHILHHNETFAKICVDDSRNQFTVTFYGQEDPMPGFGQIRTDWLELTSKFADQEVVGTCGSPLWRQGPGGTAAIDDFPTNIPTGQPTKIPTGQPTNDPTGHPLKFEQPSRVPVARDSSSTSPTIVEIISETSDPTNSFETIGPSLVPTYHATRKPTIATTRQPTTQQIPKTKMPHNSQVEVPLVDAISSYNFSCLASCATNGSSFDSNMFTSRTRQRACNYLLMTVYGTCGSFSMTGGTCEIPACASSCDYETWCFYGTGAALFCPSINWNTENLLEVHLDMQHQCLDNAGRLPLLDEWYDLKKSSLNETDNSESQVSVALLVATIVLVAVAALMIAYLVRLGLLGVLSTSDDALKHLPLSMVSDDGESAHGVSRISFDKGYDVVAGNSPKLSF